MFGSYANSTGGSKYAENFNPVQYYIEAKRVDKQQKAKLNSLWLVFNACSNPLVSQSVSFFPIHVFPLFMCFFPSLIPFLTVPKTFS